MRRKNKESEDIESYENSSMNSEEPQSKSFMIASNSRLVSLTLPGISIFTQISYWRKHRPSRSNPIVLSASEISPTFLGSIIVESAQMLSVVIALNQWLTKRELAIYVLCVARILKNKRRKSRSLQLCKLFVHIWSTVEI